MLLMFLHMPEMDHSSSPQPTRQEQGGDEAVRIFLWARDEPFLPISGAAVHAPTKSIAGRTHNGTVCSAAATHVHSHQIHSWKNTYSCCPLGSSILVDAVHSIISARRGKDGSIPDTVMHIDLTELLQHNINGHVIQLCHSGTAVTKAKSLPPQASVHTHNFHYACTINCNITPPPGASFQFTPHGSTCLLAPQKCHISTWRACNPGAVFACMDSIRKPIDCKSAASANKNGSNSNLQIAAK